MIPYPEINPVALSLGPLTIHWYGVMYLISFVLVWRLFVVRSRQPWSPIKSAQAEDLIFYGAMGVIIGGRIGYVFFYNFDQFLVNPVWLFKVWEGGMSFHGGLLGVLAAIVLLAKKYRVQFLQLGDFIAPMVPIGLGLGRLGNFIGQELWGRETSGWWSMVFPADSLQLARHPSQLYEVFLEGIVLFVILFLLSKQQRPTGFISGMFLVGYGFFRFLVEFAREPDAHLVNSLLFDWVTRGQMLCIPMMIAGSILIYWSLLRRPSINKK